MIDLSSSVGNGMAGVSEPLESQEEVGGDWRSCDDLDLLSGIPYRTIGILVIVVMLVLRFYSATAGASSRREALGRATEAELA